MDSLRATLTLLDLEPESCLSRMPSTKEKLASSYESTQAWTVRKWDKHEMYLLAYAANETFVFISKECGGTIQGTGGILQSTGYPNGYPHRHTCIWTIIAPVGRSVKLEFDDFDLETPSRSGRCRFDMLIVS